MLVWDRSEIEFPADGGKAMFERNNGGGERRQQEKGGEGIGDSAGTVSVPPLVPIPFGIASKINFNCLKGGFGKGVVR